MTSGHVNCIDCLHFDLRTAPAMAKQGYGVCAGWESARDRILEYLNPTIPPTSPGYI